MCQSLNNTQRQFTGLIDPRTRDFKTQDFANIDVLVERQKDNLCIQTRHAVLGRQLNVVRDRRRPAHRTPDMLREHIGPCLESRGPQHRIRVAHNRKA